MKIVYVFLIICFIAIVSLVLLCWQLRKSNETLKYQHQKLQMELKLNRLQNDDEKLQKDIQADSAILRRAVEFFGTGTDNLPR